MPSPCGMTIVSSDEQFRKGVRAVITPVVAVVAVGKEADVKLEQPEKTLLILVKTPD